MEQKRDREQQRRRDKHSKDSKRGRANKLDGRSSAPWRSGDVIEREGMAEASSSTSTTEIDLENGKKSGANFSRRQIESNWSKYETILPGNDEISKASDFASLMTIPISEGGHFKFKSEQTWETYSPSQFNDLFTLDLNFLSTSLSTIPFYKQLNISKELFSQDELNRMEKEADSNMTMYSHSVKEADVGSRTFPSKRKPSSSDNIVEPPQIRDNNERLLNLKLGNPSDEGSAKTENFEQLKDELLESDKDDELDFLLTLKEPIGLPVNLPKSPTEVGNKSMNEGSNVPQTSIGSETKQEDLEDWLDSILDD